ncbi:MAG: phosphate ABC transporter substrate-binding protein PstS [Pseudanabaenaceae cyanobacterium]
MTLRRRQTLYLGMGVLSAIVSGCTDVNTQASDPLPDTKQTPTSQQPVTLKGAGASFPALLYQRWAIEFSKIYKNVKVTYQSVGSGAGVKQFLGEVVDFGASDSPLTDGEIAKVKRGVLLLPVTGGSVVVAYNLPDLPNLRLSRKTYVDIFAGKITNWNNSALQQDNPNLSLPNLPIQVVYRSDSSVTTDTFTRHLSAISGEWQTRFGAGKTVKWQTGIAANGNEGVTARVQQTTGAIGYVEYGFAKQNNLAIAELQNRAGQFVSANPTTQTNGLARIPLDEQLRGSAPDPVGADVYPIVTYTWLLVYRQYARPEQVEGMQAFLTWALTTGQKFSAEMGYVPLPTPIVERLSLRIAQIGLA